MLFISYIIGLLFTLRTHAATIWTEPDEKEKKILEMSASSLSHSGHLDFPHSSMQRQATSHTFETVNCTSELSARPSTRLATVAQMRRHKLGPAPNRMLRPPMLCPRKMGQGTTTTPST
jgi:Ca2+/H+ antiporter